MDFTTIIIIGILLLAALYFFNRGRPAPRGTYDHEKRRSGGSIGGAPHRTYDDPKVRSGGSIGGRSGARSHDDDNFKSGGSIGG